MPYFQKRSLSKPCKVNWVFVRPPTPELGRIIILVHSKVLLAFFPKERRERVLNNIEFTKLTEFTITNRGELEQQLEDIRVKGFARCRRTN